MNTFAKVTTLAVMTVATVLLSTSLSSAGKFFETAGDPSEETFHTIGDNIPHQETPIEVQHTESVVPINSGIIDKLGYSGTPDKQLQQVAKAGHLALACSLGGGDLLIANAGTIGIPAGTMLKWSVKAYGEQGYVRLKSGLDAGEDVRVADVLDGNAKPGTRCAVKLSGR